MTSDSLAVVPCAGGVALRGQLTFTTAARLSDEPAVPATSADVVLDVSELTFCDSVGLAALIGASRRARRHGGTVTLRGAQRSLLRLLQVSGVHSLFTMCPAGEQQQSAFGGHGEPA